MGQKRDVEDRNSNDGDGGTARDSDSDDGPPGVAGDDFDERQDGLVVAVDSDDSGDEAESDEKTKEAEVIALTRLGLGPDPSCRHPGDLPAGSNDEWVAAVRDWKTLWAS